MSSSAPALPMPTSRYESLMPPTNIITIASAMMMMDADRCGSSISRPTMMTVTTMNGTTP